MGPDQFTKFAVEQRLITRAIRAAALHRALIREMKAGRNDERMDALMLATVDADMDLLDATELLASERGIDLDGVA